MTATYVPLTPSVLEWAMDQSGVDPAELAERADVEFDTVLEWLAGEAEPTKTQFRKITQVFKRPATFFMLPQPPEEVAVPAAFRSPAGRASHEATRSELEAIARARRVQQVARWTAERIVDSRWADDPIPAASNGATPGEAAQVAAEWLDWSVADQRAASSPSAVVRLLRAALEERGVVTLQLPVGEDGCRGFSLYDAFKPLVAVNTAYNAQARLFTYLHEVGHLMRRTDAICVGYADTTAERWCEKFAASFLLPREPFQARLDERFGAGVFIRDLDSVRLLAKDFNVSLAATAIRLEDLGMGRDLFAQIPRTADQKTRGGSGNTDTTRGAARTRELGRGFISLLLAGERAGALGRQDVLRYLDVSEGQLRNTGIGPLES
ncbi:MAG: ImmA/IrrE family metallo-endopeptidase [Solirubrobacteraceae bacterium]|nr:ImmA/IrrE family metallo-endopeptidase [Solirubrobacteraceae bacterium]